MGHMSPLGASRCLPGPRLWCEGPAVQQTLKSSWLGGRWSGVPWRAEGGVAAGYRGRQTV